MEIKKILMVTMQMGIGGAETHVLELCRALIKRGYTVHVASRGGSFVPELEAAGAKHFSMPLNTRRPTDMLKCVRALKKLIKAEGYDVVHAHSRIPAAICGYLSRRMGFRFVTTAHWVFTVTPIYRLLSDWGQKSLAVSEDIKQYLIDEYGVFPDNIRVTVNSLDTEKFSPDIDCSELKAELGLADDSFNIVCVSRMDKSRGQVPLLLARVAGKLREKYKNVNILLVGGAALGYEDSVIPEIEEICAEYSDKYGECAVKLCGPRTDINKFTAVADIFVGASRAALEAMSAECPVILAGNEGYAGILDGDSIKDAVSTNFCCRGCEMPDENRLLCDLIALIDASKEQREQLGKIMRGFILENYCLDRMADDAIAVYNTAVPMKKHADVLISGYYGFGNTGDDSLLTAIVGELSGKAPELSFAALAKDHRKAEKRFGIRCIERFNVFSVINAMRHAKLFVSGGGNLLQNGTSNKSLVYYLFTIKLAKLMGKKTMLYANGIGPLYGEKAVKNTVKIVSDCDLITLREPDSADFLKKNLEDSDKVLLSADPALLLAPATRERVDFILDKSGIPKDKEYVIVSLRSVMNKKESISDTEEADFENQFASELGELCRARDLYPIFIPMQVAYDSAVCKRVCEMCGKGSFLSDLSVSELIALISRSRFVCGMRLHSLIYSLAASVPFVALSYDPKVRSFAEYAEMPYVLDAPAGWENGMLIRAATDILENADLISEREKNKTAEFRRLAERDGSLAAELALKD